jgi:hypothetical protein
MVPSIVPSVVCSSPLPLLPLLLPLPPLWPLLPFLPLLPWSMGPRPPAALAKLTCF